MSYLLDEVISQNHNIYIHLVVIFSNRYEYQKDQNLIGENQYLYDSDWVTYQIQSSLEFWKGERKAKYVAENERWKCKHCTYASRCPVNTTCDTTIQT